MDEETQTDPRIQLDPGPDDAEAIVYDELAPNLCETFSKSEPGKRALKKISEQVMTDFKSAWDGAEEYRERRRKDWKIFCGTLPAKEFPWKDCANAHVPIMSENLSRMQMRMMSELFGNWENVMGVLPIHSEDERAAQILTKHGNWQIRNQLTDFRRQMARGLLLFITDGDIVCHSYYDTATHKNRHEMLTCEEFFCPFAYNSTEPDFSDMPFVGKILQRHRHELQRMRGEWFDVDAVLKKSKPSWDDEPEQGMRETMAEIQGISADDDGKAPYKLIEYCGWAELPNQENDRFVRVVVDSRSKAVLLLQIYEEEDWQDKVRHQRQVAELERYRSEMAHYQDAQMQMQQMQQMPLSMDPMQAQLQQESMAAMAALEPPMAPTWTDTPDDPMASPPPIKMVPIRMYAHQVCIEPLVGPLGLGYGRIQADLNVAANTALSQYSDSATSNNAKTYVAVSSLKFRNEFSLRPGTINYAEGISSQELQQAFRELTPGPANDQLIKLIDLFYQWAQSSMQSPNVLSGEPGKSGETYRGISTRIEQATKQLSVITRRFADFVEIILKNNAKLNSLFLSDEEVIFLNDTKFGGGEELRVGRALYDRDYRVEIRSDLRFASQAQRIQESDELLEMVGNVPPLQQDMPFIYHAVRKALEARNMHELVPLLGPAPAMPTTLFGAVPQVPGAMPGQPGAPAAPGGAPSGPSGPPTPEGSPPAGLEAVPGPGGPAPAAPLPSVPMAA